MDPAQREGQDKKCHRICCRETQDFKHSNLESTPITTLAFSIARWSRPAYVLKQKTRANTILIISCHSNLGSSANTNLFQHYRRFPSPSTPAPPLAFCGRRERPPLDPSPKGNAIGEPGQAPRCGSALHGPLGLIKKGHLGPEVRRHCGWDQQ